MSQDINKIINELAEIDSASAKIMQQSLNEKAKYADYINQQKKQYDRELQMDVDSCVNEYKEQLNKENEIEIYKCQKECLKDIEKLNNLFASKGEALAEGIFNNIIKE